jgi:hypothetical protein
VRLFAFLVAVVPLVSCASCVSSALPDGAQVSCESEAGCPPDYKCAGPLRRCVFDTGDDRPPGLVGTPEVSPKSGRAETKFAITVVADEPLGRPPVVTALGGGRGGDAPDAVASIELPPFRRLSDFEGDGGDRRTYRFEYEAQGNEPEGVAVVIVALVDEIGLESELTTDSFVLDFAAPKVIASSVVDGALARVGTRVVVSLSFSELLLGAEAPNIFLPDIFPETEPLFFAPSSPPLDELTELFEYVVTGSEIEGRRAVHASLVDAAGNQGDGVLGGGGGAVELPLVITLDFTAPQPGNAVMDITPHAENELITSAIDFNELLREEVFVGGDVGIDRAPTVRAILRGGDPEIDVVFLDVTHTRPTDFEDVEYTRLILQHRVRTCEFDGIYDIVLDNVVDIAGNEVDDVRGPWLFELSDVACK